MLVLSENTAKICEVSHLCCSNQGKHCEVFRYPELCSNALSKHEFSGEDFPAADYWSGKCHHSPSVEHEEHFLDPKTVKNEGYKLYAQKIMGYSSFDVSGHAFPRYLGKGVINGCFWFP